MHFPQYRKYPHNKTFFKIISFEEFEEIQINSRGIERFHFVARILPDRNYIMDLLDNRDKNWVVIDQVEYEQISK